MKLFVRIILSAVLSAPVSAAAQAKPENPGGFGEATAGNASSGPGVTGGFVSDLATNNPPGTVAADVDAARGALGSKPTPPGQSASDD